MNWRLWLRGAMVSVGAMGGILPAEGAIRYVSPGGLHIPPFANWTDAATNIQDAINLSGPGDIVLLTNGMYALPGTVRITNEVVVTSVHGRETVRLDASALPVGQDAVFLQFGTLDGLTISNAPRHGVKCESGAILNCRITHSRSNGIDSFTAPRLLSNSLLLVSNTIVEKSGSNGIFTCAVDTRIVDSLITGSQATGVRLQQNDTVAPVITPRVSNFLLQASVVSSNLAHGVALIFANYTQALPAVPVRIQACRIEDNLGVVGAGISDGGAESPDRSSGVRISDCWIRRNRATVDGGGVYFQANRAPMIERSIVEDNLADDDGGGLFLNSGILANSLVRNNYCTDNGGGAVYGTIHNATIISNRAGSQGGGAFGGSLYNSIVYYNRAASGSNITGSTVSYSCVAPLVAGAGNISGPPQLAGYNNWRLVRGSPCLDAGHMGQVSGDFDLDGEPRVWGGGVDLGCDEFYSPQILGPLEVTVESSANRAVAGTTLALQCNVEGRPETYSWRFPDGTIISNTPFVSRAFHSAGVHRIWVVATNRTSAASNSVSVEIFPGYTNYVSPAGSHVWPFTNWAEAATDIQAAISANIPGGVVVVADGVYEQGATAAGGSLPARIAITTAVSVVSVNGPERTFLVGRGPLGDNAVRCAHLGPGARLAGFTLSNGHTRLTGDLSRDQSGGGAWCEPDAILERCVIRNNAARQAGGGVRGGIVRQAQLRENVAAQGGGAAHAVLENVLLTANQADYGGGAADSQLGHVTAAANHAAISGGGVYRCVVSNSIVYFNTAAVSWPNYFNSVCRYTCTVPDPQTIGNLTNDPLFVAAAAGIFRLQRGSPALDAAAASPIATDLLGVPRPLPGTLEGAAAPDLGAYEFTPAHYVSPAGAHVYPFATWADAAADIQSAVDAADEHDEVFVSNGVYQTGGRAHPNLLTNRVVVDKPLFLTAVRGPETTVIVGEGPIGDTAIRGVYLAAHSVMRGFAISHGATRAAGDPIQDQSGGGVLCEPGALLVNCLIRSNQAAAYGGGVYGGNLLNSFLGENRARWGGGLARGHMEFSTAAWNQADDGGGAYESTGRYSIVYHNLALGGGEPNISGGSWSFCCLLPDPGGPGHIVDPPEFLSAGDFRLGASSPCIDVLSPEPGLPQTDLLLTPRPLDGNNDGIARHDLGAHEFIHPLADTDSDQLPDSAEIHQHHTSPLLADTDGDGQSDYIEVIAGTDPHDPTRFFAILSASIESGQQILAWPGRAQRLYTLVTTDNLSAGMTNSPHLPDWPGTDGIMTITNPLADPRRFYGVRVRLAP